MDRETVKYYGDRVILCLAWGVILYIPVSCLISFAAGRNHTDLSHLLDRLAYYLIIAFFLHFFARIAITLTGYIRKNPVAPWFKGVYSLAAIIVWFDAVYLFMQLVSRF